MRSTYAITFAAVAAMAMTSPARASTGVAEPSSSREQPIGSTALVSVGFSISEILIQDPDVNDGGTISTFIANSLGGPSQVYLRRAGVRAPELVSRTNDGDPGFGDSEEAKVSPDGGFVVFSSWADDIGPGNLFGDYQVYLYDTKTKTNRLLSATANGTVGNGGSVSPSISPDSRYVVYASDARNLVGGQSSLGLYIFDTTTGRNSAVDPGARRGFTSQPAISSGGRYIAFASEDVLAPGDTNSGDDVFRYDSQTDATALVSRGRGAETFPGAESLGPQISADGNRVCYTSSATNLVPGDPGTGNDVFLTDATARSTQLVSRTVSGGWPGRPSNLCDLSADGRYVSFDSTAPDLVASDTNRSSDVFVADTTAGTTELVVHGLNGDSGDDYSADATISADGRYVAYRSYASNLTRNDTDDYDDAFLYRRS